MYEAGSLIVWKDGAYADEETLGLQYGIMFYSKISAKTEVLVGGPFSVVELVSPHLNGVAASDSETRI